jgi:hypothetical protein
MIWLGIGLHVKKGIKYKQALITALVLALPSLEQPFHLFVNVNKGIALRVLTQKHGGQCQKVWPSYLNS